MKIEVIMNVSVVVNSVVCSSTSAVIADVDVVPVLKDKKCVKLFIINALPV